MRPSKARKGNKSDFNLSHKAYNPKPPIILL